MVHFGIQLLYSSTASIALNICLWHRGACRIIGLDVSMTGQPSTGAPELFVANHVS